MELLTVIGVNALMSTAIRRQQEIPRTGGELRGARILLVTPQPFYEDRGTPIAVRYVSQALAELGAWVDLLAFPIGKAVAIPHVRILRCRNPLHVKAVPIGLSLRKLVLDVSLTRSFAQRLATREYDLVHAVEEAAYIAAYLCGRDGPRFIYDMASSIPQSLRSRPIMRNTVVQGIAARAEQRVLDRATHVVCSSGLASYVRERQAQVPLTEWRFPLQHIGTDKSAVSALRKQLGLSENDPVLVYCGNFASYQGMDLLLAAFQRARLRIPDLILICVGATDHDVSGWNSGRQCASGRVLVIGRQPREQVAAYLQLADVLISPRVSGDNVPLKLFDYMSAAKPIVATRGPAHQPLLDDERGYLCDRTPESMSAAIVRAFESPWEARAMGHRVHRYAERQFGWGRFVDLVSGVYRSALPVQLKSRRWK